MNKKRMKPSVMRILFSCVGRRIELLEAFRRAAESLGVALDIHGADASWLAPGMHRVDRAHLVPPIADRAYADTLIEIVRRHRIRLLIPLNDLELPVIARHADVFAGAECVALISSPAVIDVCRDKLATFQTLRAHGIDTPTTWTWEEAVRRKRPRFPCYLKPRFGSAARGNFIVRDRDELHVFGRRVPQPVVQELVRGTEYTLDVYTGFDGKPRCVVPRRRLEVRTGEVSKALIVKDDAIMDTGCRVAGVLQECRGVVTIQCIRTVSGRIRTIEINPRFGGGVPLSIHAGADFPRWILSERLGLRPRIQPAGFRDDLALLRFDGSVLVRNASRLLDAPAGADAGAKPSKPE